jgi:hypothetical protein
MDVLETFRSVSDHANCIGAVRAVTHNIRLKKDEPFRLRPYPVSDKKKKQLFQCVQEMLAAGVIERSVSDYCSPAVLVTKKDGTVRFCTDYRKLNLLTEDEAAPLPKISDALREFGSATVFSAIDLKSGYWQIPMDKASKHLTAFATPDGATYQYRVMPFGLKNAPATFQKLMTRVLEGHLGKFAHVYLDDIIIFSRDHREHLVHLRLILERLQEYGLRCATEKCRFGVTELPYLGHIVGGNHNRPQPKHLEQIRSAPTPTTRKQLQSFLGLANWVRDYVPRFAELAAPITDLLNKKSRYRWTEEAQQAFEALKEAMSPAPPSTRPQEAVLPADRRQRRRHLWLRAEPPLLWVPPAARARVLHEFHDSPVAGHPGREETIRAIRAQYTWPALSNLSNRFLLVVTDVFSKWVEAFPMRRATAKATVRALENEVFCHLPSTG